MNEEKLVVGITYGHMVISKRIFKENINKYVSESTQVTENEHCYNLVDTMSRLYETLVKLSFYYKIDLI